MNWQGVWVALVTPFKKDQVDVLCIERLTTRLIESGVSGICPCGTTGEGSSLTEAEFAKVVQAVLKTVDGKVPVVPGTGTNNTQKTIERTLQAKELGVQGALVVTPYYVKPTQEGLRRHYTAISEKVDLPLMLYNVPGRTAVNLLPETVEKLTQEANVGAMKECAPLSQVAELIQRVGSKISVFSGEDGVFLPFLSLGGKGMVSVLGNVAPKEWVQIYEDIQQDKMAHAQKNFLKLRALTEILFVESNPIPVKAVLYVMGLIEPEIRSPLSWVSEKNLIKIKNELHALGLLSL